MDENVRAKRRALHLLERMDRTEYQLRRKLAEGGYPQECIDGAIDYVKSFHYLDDYRYACSYVRCNGNRLSRLMLKQKLSGRGVARDVIERALAETYEGSERERIRQLLVRRHFCAEEADEREFRRTYQYLLRRGYSGNEVLCEMKKQLL